MAISVAKTITGATYAQVEKSLDAGAGAGWAAVSGSVPSRAIDPDLARRIHEIELDLGMARFEGSERSSVVLLRRRIPTLHRPTRSCCQRVSGRSRYQSRGGGAHRGGLGRVNSSGRDVAEYNLEREHTSSTSSAGLPKRRAVDTYACDALWLGPSWPCICLDRYTQSTL